MLFWLFITERRARCAVPRHAARGVLLATLAMVATVATSTTSIGGPCWRGSAMALATTVGLVNSWVLLVEIERETRCSDHSRPHPPLEVWGLPQWRLRGSHR
jgi:hypothetical protein